MKLPTLSRKQQIVARAFCAFLPVFVVWHLSYPQYLSPVVAAPIALVSQSVFPKEKLRIEVAPEGNWNIHSHILEKEQPNAAKGSVQVRSMHMKSNQNFTLGLPLLWCLCFAIAATLRKFVQSLIVGSALMMFAVWLSAFSDFYLSALHLLRGAEGMRVYLGAGELDHVQPVSGMLIEVVARIRQFGYYFTILPLPVLILWFVNRQDFRSVLELGNPSEPIDEQN